MLLHGWYFGRFHQHPLTFLIITPKQVRRAIEQNSILQQQNQELQSRLVETERNTTGLREEFEQQMRANNRNLASFFSSKISQLGESKESNQRTRVEYNRELIDRLRTDRDLRGHDNPNNAGSVPPPAPAAFTHGGAPAPAPAAFTHGGATALDLAGFNSVRSVSPAAAATYNNLPPLSPQVSPTHRELLQQLEAQQNAPFEDSKPPAAQFNFEPVIPSRGSTRPAPAAPAEANGAMPPPPLQPTGAGARADATSTDGGSLASDGIEDVTHRATRRSARPRKPSEKAIASEDSIRSVASARSSRSKKSKGKRSAPSAKTPLSVQTRTSQRVNTAQKSPHGTLPLHMDPDTNFYNNNNIIEDDSDI